MSGERDEDGRYMETVADEDILHHFDAGPRYFYSANEVADEFDFDRSQAHRRLARLTDRGELERVAMGRRNVVWWRPRDVAVFIEGESGFTIIHRESGVASQGDTRPEALRMLAEAIEASEGASEVAPDEIYEELGIDPGEIPKDASPPWEE